MFSLPMSTGRPDGTARPAGRSPQFLLRSESAMPRALPAPDRPSPRLWGLGLPGPFL